ncbi:MAG: hypothetical protein IJO65_11380 [Lachnospiraceae bacterium]|nr:hypothetical protein [Lachnospiraceae bacterium]
MNNINKVLLMLIAMVAIMLIAVGIDKGYDYYQDVKWEKERVAAYEEAKADVEAMQSTIATLSEDPDALIAYIEENELNYVEVDAENAFESVYGNDADSSSSASMSEGSISDNASEVSQGGDGSVSDNSVSGEGGSVSGNELAEGSVSDNSVSGNSVSDNSVSDNSVSDNSVSDNSVSDNSVSDNNIIEEQPAVSANTSKEKKLCASYEETMQINKADKQMIAQNSIDFSGMKIACLGDSITEAANLTDEEGYEQMTYPYQLSQLLGAREVVNLGIGGSSIGRYWDQAFVDRYQEIPQDTDLIIIMGGTNDGFCASEEELGSLEEREARTFAGDLDELLRGLKENYPDAEIVLVSPLSNVLHDMLRKEREHLLPQSAFVAIMKELAAEYDVHFIDLYHSNLLDTHDAAIIHNFMPDGVHGNAAGYKILAEHMAAEIIGLYEEMAEAEMQKEAENEQ